MDITLEHVTHVYNPRTPFERLAIDDVNLFIPSGSFTSIIGQTGSGKSTLVQHINGLLKPSKGRISAGKMTIEADGKKSDLKALREKVGFVFQYPEHQLFEETIIKDVCFGPMNFGVSAAEATTRAEESLNLVGLPSSYWHRSPFDLSGGQMRRVAIAGVLAIHPEVIILDEPTAGLDPQGRREILHLFDKLHKEFNLTLIMVTHNMGDAALYSDQVVVMADGRPVMVGKPEKVFAREEELRKIGLDVPETMMFLDKLAAKFGAGRIPPVFTIQETADRVMRLLNGGSENV
ncbi:MULTISPECIES: energy-coupling factor transporter ATPase [unclassified Sporolactobacillus]|uniref:energy-coupling factor transporter ATPase n=1 Tax=unclassified Sporolactobacillus TaxID=2628533 RepID=UPI002368C49F|nr:energy-coupling factor transporter ATPase [Sporolactobacillus sp. CQH2019]MDD9150551.1 energy-coupling factor transporter ATPase [Sporolactobacillus sp. CQH2019]